MGWCSRRIYTDTYTHGTLSTTIKSNIRGRPKLKVKNVVEIAIKGDGKNG